MTILEKGNIIYDVFMNEKELNDFLETTPEYEYANFTFVYITDVNELYSFTFALNSDVKKIQSQFNYRYFKPKMTIETYDNSILKLPIDIQNRYFNWISKNEEKAHFINQLQNDNISIKDNYYFAIATLPLMDLTKLEDDILSLCDIKDKTYLINYRDDYVLLSSLTKELLSKLGNNSLIEIYLKVVKINIYHTYITLLLDLYNKIEATGKHLISYEREQEIKTLIKRDFIKEVGIYNIVINYYKELESICIKNRIKLD